MIVKKHVCNSGVLLLEECKNPDLPEYKFVLKWNGEVLVWSETYFDGIHEYEDELEYWS